MKQLHTKMLLLLSALFFTILVKAQGVAVNANGAAADSSAMLDVSSAKKGILIPRMLSTQRTAIALPATGMLVYQTDSVAGFYQYNGTKWLSLLADSVAAGGDLTGKYPNPSISTSATAGTHIISAINGATGVINPANLGTGTANSSSFLRGDGTWSTPASAAKFVIAMNSGYNPYGLTIQSTGQQDSVLLTGMGVASKKWVDINGGSYIDASAAYPSPDVTVPVAATITSFSFSFHYNSQSVFLAIFGNYTLQAQLYYAPPPASNLLGGDQFFPVPGASVSFNTTTLASLVIYSERFIANVSGLSFPMAAGSRLLILVTNSSSTVPSSPAGTFNGDITAAVGMQ